MEKLSFFFKNGHLPAPKNKILVGVVSSGNLEVLIEPIPSLKGCEIKVNTTIRGFSQIWQAVFTSFFEKHPYTNTRITINDAGGTPAVVSLRLDQAIEMTMGEQQ